MVRLSTVSVQQLINTLAGKPDSTLEDVAELVAMLVTAGGGGDSVLTQQIATALTGKAQPTPAELVAAVAGFLGEPLAQQILDQFGGTVADLTAYIVGVDDNLSTTTVMAFSAQSGLEQFLTTVAGNPDPSLITVPNGGLPGLAGKAWEALVAQVAAGGGGGDVQPLLDLLAVKPDATVADVEVVWQSLSNQANDFMVLLSLLSGQGVNSNVTIADVQSGLPRLVEAIVQMVLSKPFAGPLNVTPSLTAGAIGLAAEIVAVHPENKPCNLDLQAPGGAVLVNGEQILNPSQVSDVALAVVKAWLAVDVNSSGGVVGSWLNTIGQGLAQEVQTRTEQTEGLNLGYKHLRETLVLPTIRAITGSTDASVGNGVDGPAVAAVKPAMDKIRADTAAAATKTELQSLVNALCSAPFAGMAGNVVNNVGKVGVWVNIVKQEIESLEANLTFVHGKTVENKTAIAALKATVEALEALGVGGGDGTGLTEAQAQMIVDNAAGVATLRAENAALKARLDVLEAKTVSLTNDGKLSTADVLGDGFLDAGGNAIVPDLNQGLQLLVDALTWGVEGGYGANGQTIETLYDALVVQSRTLETQAEVAEYLLQRDEWVVENLTALVTYIQEQIAEVAAFSQGIIDAMNGPDATLESIAGMFWLLNDVITALIEATGIELPGKA